MPKIIVYYAHPGDQHSNANKAMQQQVTALHDISNVDLYREYPRFNIDVDKEQNRLLEHDIIVFQFPVFWYSSPSIIKEWLDLVLEHGFAYGTGGDRLKGKSMLLALTTGGSQEAYTPEGQQQHTLATFLSPFQQTAALCQMAYIPPYVLFGALDRADTNRMAQHAHGFAQLIEALKNNSFNHQLARQHDTIGSEHLSQLTGSVHTGDKA